MEESTARNVIELRGKRASVNHEIGNESQLKGKQMEIGLIICAVVVVGCSCCILWWVWNKWAFPHLDENYEADNRAPYSEPEPQTPESSKVKMEGITELIWQQEQTNRHLQKLIKDFFWFRIAIIGLLIFGGIGATGGFK